MTEINVNYLPSYLLNDDGTIIEGGETEATRISAGVAQALSELPPTEQNLFMVLLKTDLIVEQEDEQYSVDQLQESLALIAAAAQKLAEMLEAGGGSLTLAHILIAVLYMQQMDALETRERSRLSSRDLLMGEAGEIVKAAKKAFKGSTIEMITAFAAAAVTVATAVASMSMAARQASQSATATEQEAKLNSEQAELSNPNLTNNRRTVLLRDIQKSTSAMRSSQASSTRLGHYSETMRILGRQGTETGSTVGGFVQSEYQMDSKLAEAEGSKNAALSAQETGNSDLARTFQSGFESAIDETRKAIETLLNIEVDQLKAMLRG